MAANQETFTQAQLSQQALRREWGGYLQAARRDLGPYGTIPGLDAALAHRRILKDLGV